MVARRRRTRARRTYRVRKRGGLKKTIQNIVSRNIETKVIHHTLTPLLGVPNSTQFLNVLDTFLTTQGVNSNQFIGKEIRLQSLNMNGMLQQHDTSNIVRLIFFRARGSYTPVAGNVQLFHSSNNPLFSTLDRSYVKEVKFDHLYVLNNDNAGSDHIKLVRKYVNFKNSRFLMKGLADSAQLWYLCYISDSSIVPGPRMNLNMTMRIKDA